MAVSPPKPYCHTDKRQMYGSQSTQALFANSKFFLTSIASLDPETVELPAFYMLPAMFTGARGPLEKLSLALVPRMRMIMKLAYCLLVQESREE